MGAASPPRTKDRPRLNRPVKGLPTPARAARAPPHARTRAARAASGGCAGWGAAWAVSPRPVASPVGHHLAHRRHASVTVQVPGDGMASHQQGQLDPLQLGQHGLAPGRSAFRAGRQVAAAAGSRVAEAHGHQGDAGDVVEGLAIGAHPLAQAVAAGVVERNAGLVHATARGLANHQDARLTMGVDHRARRVRQGLGTVSAGADLGQQGLQSGHLSIWPAAGRSCAVPGWHSRHRTGWHG